MSTTVTSKGQVTIPKAVRELLGVLPGSKVEFKVATNGDIVLKRADGTTPEPNRFAKYRGFLGPSPTTDEIMAMLRGDD